MNGLLKELKDTYKFGTALTRFLFINIAVFIVFRIFFVIFNLTDAGYLYQFGSWFNVPAYLPSLMLKPWTLLTYMFYHEEFYHIIFNMVSLFWFGKLFLAFFTGRQFTTVYLLGGFGGALMYILFYNIFPAFHSVLPVTSLLGASASVVALIVAVSFYAPNQRLNMLFIGEVKLIYLGIFTILIDVVMMYSSNSGGHISHLGGALFGYIWAMQYKNGRDFTVGFSNFLGKIEPLFKRKKLKVSYKKAHTTEYDYNKVKMENQKEIDRILDKISKGGYDNLSKEEKDTLFRMGKN